MQFAQNGCEAHCDVRELKRVVYSTLVSEFSIEMTQNIPIGRTKEDIKAREQLIKDFYANWISEHPDKKVFNLALGRYICVKFLSINETYEKASRSPESTLAVFRLTEILQNATFVEELPAKRNTRNQKQFEKLLVLRYEDIKLTIGLQRSNQDLVQYCITVPQTMSQNKAINSGE